MPLTGDSEWTGDMTKRRPVFANTKHLARERERRRKQKWRILLILFLISIPIAGWIWLSIVAF